MTAAASPTLQTIANLIALVILALLTAVLPKVRAWIDSHTTENTRRLLGDAVKIAINATEQAVRDQTITGDNNADRLAYAITVVRHYAKLWGLTVDADDKVLGPLIKAMLWREDNWHKDDQVAPSPMTVPGGQTPRVYMDSNTGASWVPLSGADPLRYAGSIFSSYQPSTGIIGTPQRTGDEDAHGDA